MRSKKVIEEKIWDVSKSLKKRDPDSMEHDVEYGIIVGLQWALGAEFCGEGEITKGTVCGAIVKGKK